MAFTPDGRYLITTSESGKYNHAAAIRVWNAATGALIHSFHDPGSYGSTRLALSHDGSILAVADDDARAYLWSLEWLHRWPKSHFEDAAECAHTGSRTASPYA